MKWLKRWAIFLGLPVGAIALFYLWASAGHFDKQNYAAIVNYAPKGAPDNTPAGQPASSFQRAEGSYTIVSYNIGYLSGLANNTTTRPERSFFEKNQAQAIAALQGANPDIVAFQEIDFGAQRSYNLNQAEAMGQALGLYEGAIAINWDKNYLPFPYWPPSAHFGKILSGQAILSRYPIKTNSRLVLEKVAGNNFIYNAFYLDRLAQVTQLEIEGQPLMVINLHLEAFDGPTRLRQTQFVRELAENYAKTYPVIVLGDFNSALNRESEGNSFSIAAMADSGLFISAAFPDQPEAATFPANAPRYKLDYIFYTPNRLEMLDTAVLKTAREASDHLPVMMRFRFK